MLNPYTGIVQEHRRQRLEEKKNEFHFMHQELEETLRHLGENTGNTEMIVILTSRFTLEDSRKTRGATDY